MPYRVFHEALVHNPSIGSEDWVTISEQFVETGLEAEELARQICNTEIIAVDDERFGGAGKPISFTIGVRYTGAASSR